MIYFLRCVGTNRTGMFISGKFSSWLCLFGSLCLFGLVSPAMGQEEDNLPARPACNRILPEETVLYFRVRSMPELIDVFRENGLDQMMADERLSSLVGDLYKEFKDEYDEKVKGELEDVELDQFQDLFAGEVCLAIVAKRRQNMEFVVILDVKPETDTLDRLLSAAERRAEEKGRPVETDDEDEVEINILRTGGERDIFYFRQEDTVYAATNRDLCAEMIANLKGKPLEKTRQFVENRKYRTIMGQCRVDKDNPPLMTFFVDPIEVFKAATRGDTGAAIAVGFLPVLGLDGLLGIGGAVLPGDNEFTSISHVHLLMSSPREGLLRAISFRSGSYAVPSAVPEDTATLMVTSLDIPKLYSGIESIYNTFNGEDGFASLVERGSEALGFDIKTDLLDLMTGSLIFITRGDPESMAFNGASNAYFLEFNDAEKAQETMDMLMDRVQEETESDVFRSVKKNGQEYWIVEAVREQRDRARERRREFTENLDADARALRERGREFEERYVRSPVPAFTFLESHFVITDSVELMEHLIATYQGRAPNLNESDHYSAVRRKAEVLLGGKPPAGVMYNRPINQLSSIWNAVRDKEMVEMFKGTIDEQPLLTRLADAFARNELPPLEEMQDYFRTSGGFMTDDATGLHFLFFEMKNQKE